MATKQRVGILPLSALLVFVVVVMVVLWRTATRGPVHPAQEHLPPEPIPDTVVLSPDVRETPGGEPATTIRYRHPTASRVLVAGSWNHWDTNCTMSRFEAEWRLDMHRFKLPLGRYEFKFLPNGEWEPGANRVLFVSEHGLVERPPDIVFSARQETPTRIDVLFKREIARKSNLRLRLVPEHPVSEVKWVGDSRVRRRLGFDSAGEFVTFCMVESFYEISIPNSSRVAVAGSFNGWNGSGGNSRWLLEDKDDDNIWERVIKVEDLYGGVKAGAGPSFKFVVNGDRWLQPPADAPNAHDDGKGNTNLRLDPEQSRSATLQIHLDEPLPLSNACTIVFENLAERPVIRTVTPGAVLDSRASRKELGVSLDHSRGRTVYRLFAPRAKRVDLCLYDGPHHATTGTEAVPAPAEILPMQLDPSDSVWEREVAGLQIGQYYAFRVDGPRAGGEGFDPTAEVGDPYARAMAHACNNSIVIDPDATNDWFAGWSDDTYSAPAWQDAVIYELHIRDLTQDPSSNVPAGLRGTYQGLLASAGTGTGLDHLKALGVNMLELMPVSEFANGTNRYEWGYAPAFFFAPEASFAQDPLNGSQYYEFKHLVNELHKHGFGVILDVVYNHMGSINVFERIDRKYFFRLDAEFTHSNFSGCGNDVRTEAPMMRRLIIDNVLYWMKEFHIDGFRFDLAELIDMQTLMELRDAARAVNPNVLLISEPWSFRRDHKYDLTGTGWAAWNNEFRDTVKHFALGRGDRDKLKKAIRGSVDTWTADPMQSINYVESHDDKCLTDDLTSHPEGDGRVLNEVDAARHRIAATLLFTSLGIPMLSEGQEFMRSKRGIRNTYNKGDEVNALRWTDRDRPLAAETQQYYKDLLRLRRSPAGLALRWNKTVPDDYFRWIEPADARALGYEINGRFRYPGAGFVVLCNSADGPVDFDVVFASGRWRLIGDGRRLAAGGVPGSGQGIPVKGGRQLVRVPARTAHVFMGEQEPQHRE